MRSSQLASIAVAGLIAIAGTVAVAAQSAPGGRENVSAAYRPGLGDLMTMTVEPRHIKLAAAGRERNWPYAAYELHQLDESFERVARNWPRWRGFPIASMIEAVVKEPMTMLAQAIKKADAGQYERAYKDLTDGCNSCHQAANVGVNAIVVPHDVGFPDQDFRPLKP